MKRTKPVVAANATKPTLPWNRNESFAAGRSLQAKLFMSHFLASLLSLAALSAVILFGKETKSPSLVLWISVILAVSVAVVSWWIAGLLAKPIEDRAANLADFSRSLQSKHQDLAKSLAEASECVAQLARLRAATTPQQRCHWN